VDTHTFTNKPKKFKQLLSACQISDGNCFLSQERSVDGGIRATRDHNNVRNVFRNTKNLQRAIRMLTSCVVLLHDSARPHTAARTRVLLEHFNWELFEHPPYSPDLAPNDCHLFTRTYRKNW
jgi:hypothetical protein